MFGLKSKYTKGFTLVEVIVVISVIGVLSTVAVFSFQEVREQARDRTRMASLKQLQIALENYRADHGVYPEDGCGSAKTWTGPGPFSGEGLDWGETCSEYIDDLVPDYISALPLDPNREDEDNRGFLYQSDGVSYKVLVNTVESLFVEQIDHEFARCPEDCDLPYCDDEPREYNYAVYSDLAQCW